MKRTILPIFLLAILTVCLPMLSLLFPAAAEFEPPKVGFSTSAVSDPFTTQPDVLQAESSPESQASETATEAMIYVQNAPDGTVLAVPVLDYMIGAVASEMPITWSDEALKAQGIAAHSYALYQRDHADTERLNGAWFSVDPARRQGYMSKEVLQSYWGDAFEGNYQRLKELLEPLQDTVLLYNGEPAAACYHAISNGHTESSQLVWNEALPYLQGVDSSVDLSAEGYLETVEYTTQQMYDMLATQFAGIDLDKDPAEWFGESTLTPAGYVDTMQVGGIFIKGTQLRAALGLRSSCFSIALGENGFQVTTKGYGHGVGLSQCGAQAMAQQGSSYQDILSWYYPGTTLDTYTH